MPTRLYTGSMSNYELGLDEDEDYLMVEDPENLFLLPELNRGFYFSNNIVIEISGDYYYWECVNCFPRDSWETYKAFISSIGV